jgi:uncharacterized LabA/DUF88 family protein
MLNQTYAYVDGESHFIRARAACKNVFGGDAELDHLDVVHGGFIKIRFECKFYWLRRNHDGFPPERMIYFTSVTGNEPIIIEHQKWIRDQGFEPVVIREEKALAKRREADLKEFKMIEKPKGVDIALATRMLEDAVNGNYKFCRLYTSDADYLPVIQAVRRMGKIVWVYGAREGIPDDSPLLYVPDQFHDIGEAHFRQILARRPPERDRVMG